MKENAYYDKLREKYSETANMSNEEVAEWKKTRAKEQGIYTDEADGTSRESFGAEILGSLSDLGNLVAGNYRGGNQTGYIDEKGNYHQRTCFTRGTPVSTLYGKKPVEEVKDGDIVFAKDEKTGKIVLSKVQQTYVRKTDRIYKLEYEDGMVIETTPTHPFRIQRADGGQIKEEWMEARFLKVGDRSVRRDSGTLAISHIAFDDREETVYNFTVEDNHNYFVGDSEVLVHNEEYATLIKGVIGAYYSKTGSATKALKDALNDPNLSDADKAKLKSELAKEQALAKKEGFSKRQGQFENNGLSGLGIESEDSFDSAWNKVKSLGSTAWDKATSLFGSKFGKTFIDNNGKVLPADPKIITSDYGERPNINDGFHHGIDFGLKHGDPVVATGDGTVTTVYSDPKNQHVWGNHTIISHPDGKNSLYAHQSKQKVKHSEKVKTGQIIGEVGNSGGYQDSNGKWKTMKDHLHYGIWKNGESVNPRK